jgi:hypothetical protein
MSLKKVICTGSPNTEDKAITYLKQQGAIVNSYTGIKIIELPEKAKLAKEEYYNSIYIVSFSGPDGNDIGRYIRMYLIRFLLTDGESFAKEPGYFEKVYQAQEVDQAHADVKAKANEREPQTIEFIESAQEFEALYNLSM